MVSTPLLNPITQFELSNQIIDANLFEKVKLTASAKLVLMVLCRYYPRIYPCQKTIAKKTGLSLRTVINAIAELKQKGLLLVECNYSNTYKFTGVFFELAEISHSTRKNCTQHGEKTAHNKTINKTNKKAFNKNSGFQSVEGIRILPADEVIRQFDEDKKKATSPLDWDKHHQIDYYQRLPEFAKNGIFAKEIKRRWNL